MAGGEREASQRFIEIVWVVDDQVITFCLTGEEPINGFRSQPFFMNSFAFHPVEPGIEFCFQLVPFCTVRMSGTP